MYKVFRLTYGMDLKKSIEDYCMEHGINSATLLTTVGCLYEASIRLADGKTVKQFKGRYEIVSLTGTISKDGSHLHVSLADEQGNVIGGHLCYGCLVNTTAEVVVCQLSSYDLAREYDESTGYKELVIKEIGGNCNE